MRLLVCLSMLCAITSLPFPIRKGPCQLRFLIDVPRTRFSRVPYLPQIHLSRDRQMVMKKTIRERQTVTKAGKEKNFFDRENKKRYFANLFTDLESSFWVLLGQPSTGKT